MRSSFTGVCPRTSPSTRNSAPPGSEAIETTAQAGVSFGSSFCSRPSPSISTSDRGVEIALGVYGHGVTPRGQLERSRRFAAGWPSMLTRPGTGRTTSRRPGKGCITS